MFSTSEALHKISLGFKERCDSMFSTSEELHKISLDYFDLLVNIQFTKP